MAEVRQNLRENVFTELRLPRVGELAVTALKRGRSGQGYPVTVTTDYGTPYALTPDQTNRIRTAIDTVPDAEKAALTVAGLAKVFTYAHEQGIALA